MDSVFQIPESGCWIWGGYIDKKGYGVSKTKAALSLGVGSLAHRISYKLHGNEIPDGLCLDHLCRVTCCVNPKHLEPVTAVENTRRGVRVGAVIAEMSRSKTHCPSGHPYSGNNLYFRSNGARECKACDSAYYFKKKAKLNALKELQKGS